MERNAQWRVLSDYANMWKDKRLVQIHSDDRPMRGDYDVARYLQNRNLCYRYRGSDLKLFIWGSEGIGLDTGQALAYSVHTKDQACLWYPCVRPSSSTNAWIRYNAPIGLFK